MIQVQGAGGMIAVDDGGAGEPPCLFIHSLGGRRDFWQPVLDQLRKNYRAVALDLRGHGQSGAEAAVMELDDFAADVLRVADALRLDRFILVGHSFGATVALAVASRAPRRIMGLVLLDAAGAFDDVPVAALEDFIDQVTGDSGTAFVREAYETNLERAKPSTRDVVLGSLEGTDRDTIGAAYTSLFGTDPRQLLLRYPGPVRLIVDAANDSPMSLHAQLPDLDIVPVRDSSHWIMLDQPEQVTTALKEFIDAQREQA